MKRKPALSPSLLLILVMNLSRGQTLTCHQSEYQAGTECCLMCPVGYRVKMDCTAYQYTSCVPCTEGTYMNLPTGLKQCFPCTDCDAGSGVKMKTSCTTSSDTVCEPLEGFFCLDPTENGCMAAQKHTGCKPGQYIRHNGTAQRDTECSDCSEGQYSDGTFTSCLSHTQCESLNLQLIKPGTVSTDAKCGKQTSGVTAVVVISVVTSISIAAALVLVMFLLKKKKGCLNTEKDDLGMGETGRLHDYRNQHQQDDTNGYINVQMKDAGTGEDRN